MRGMLFARAEDDNGNLVVSQFHIEDHVAVVDAHNTIAVGSRETYEPSPGIVVTIEVECVHLPGEWETYDEETQTQIRHCVHCGEMV